MTFVISDPSVVVNNEPVGIVPGSVKFSDGDGEYKMRAQSTGNGNVEQVFSIDVTTKFSALKFSLYNDITSIENARKWKRNLNANVVTVTGKDPSGATFTRTFTKAAILNDYEVELGSDSSFELEFASKSAV